MSTPNPEHAPKGLMCLADDVDQAAAKLTAAIDASNRETAAAFAAEFQPPTASGAPEAAGGIAPTS